MATKRGKFEVEYTNKDIMDKLESIHMIALATNGKVRFHTKLIWGAYGFAFALLLIVIQHVME